MRSYTQIIHPPPSSKNTDTLPNKSIPKNHNKQISTSQQSANPEPNLKAPRPILQTKITKTHANLMEIPLSYRPELIQQLYLSHNHIVSVRNRLRIFVSLRNLNLSYNLLEDVGQFVGEINGNVEVVRQQKQWRGLEARLEKLGEGSKIELKMLCIRMNKFAYGYQDEIIRMIDSLERFQDFNFIRNVESKTKTTDPQSQNPKQIFQIAHKVSEYFLPSYSNLLNSIQSLTAIHSLLFQQQSQPLLSTITSSSISSKYEKYISKLSTLLHPKKEIKYLPCSRKGALLNILEFQMICIELQEQYSVDRVDCKQKNGIFMNLVKELLMIFGNRNNFQLLNSLRDRQKGQDKNKQIDLNNLDSLCFLFGQIYKATRYTIYEPNPGKYLAKIDPNQVREHPFLQYMNYDKQKRKQEAKPYFNNWNTLDGNRRRTKNTMIRQFGKFAEKENDTDSLDFQRQQRLGKKIETIYQNMPIIVYERNYLQIIQQIWQLKLKNFIKIYDLVIHKLRQTQQNLQNPQPKFVSFQLRQKKDGKTVPIQKLPADVYLEEDKETVGNSRIQIWNVKKQRVKQGKENCVNQNVKQTPSYILVQEQKQQEKVEKNEQNRKTLPKFGDFNGTSRKYRKKASQKDKKNKNNDLIQTQPPVANQKEEVYKPNLAKYSIYQINLAYKVLTALKKNKNKSKKARAKANPESNQQSYEGTEKTKKLSQKAKPTNINEFTFKNEAQI